jgi:tetratricopeptide (TPR) repeat protein
MRDKGHRLHRESLDLARRAGVKPPRFERGLFRTRAPQANQSLETGRRYLQACLRIDPTHAHARLYLGHYFRATGRTDRAKTEFRKVALSGADRRTRLMALVKLGIALAYERRYLKAIACFRKVWETRSARHDPLLGMSSAANLAIFTAKIDRFDLSMKYFGELIQAFPNRAEEMRRMLARQTGFKDILRRKAGFRDQLKERYPALFAS